MIADPAAGESGTPGAGTRRPPLVALSRPRPVPLRVDETPAPPPAAPMSDVAETLADHLEASPPEGVASVYLFGSEAEGRAHRESDVDVGVLFDRDALPDRDRRSEAAVGLASELIGVLHRNDVQVVSLIDVSPELASTAVRRGRRVHCADPELDRREVRDLLLRSADLAPFLRRTRTTKLEALGA